MTTPSDTLSVVLPVRDDAAALRQRVAELLEILPDLTPQFDVLILDNASSDCTDEVAHDLTRRYPQVSFLRQSERVSDDKALELGLENTSGNLVVVFDRQAPIHAGRIKKLWDLRGDRRVVIASQGQSSGSLVERLKTWASQLTPDDEVARDGVQMIRREAIHELPIQPSIWQVAAAPTSVPSVS